MKKNDTITVIAEDYTNEGLAVTRADGMVFFVPGLIKGEEAEIGITKLKKNYGYARVVRITKPSEHRVDPVCDVNRLCGGCQLLHMDYEEQKRFKEDKVRACFRQNAGMEADVMPILTSGHLYGYRNKVQVPVQYRDGVTKMGFYQNHTNTIIDYTYCHAQTELSNQITKRLKSMFIRLNCSQEVRHVLIKHAHRTGEIMIALVVRHWPFDQAEELKEWIVREYPDVKSLLAIRNQREDNVILDGKEYVLYGRPYIEEELLGCRFRISARSFFQINPYATEILYSTALDFAGLTGKETVVDLYCGTGTIGMLASRRAKKVYGVEVVSDAVKDANINAQANDIRNIEFLNMDASAGARAFIRSKIKADVVIVDPPRKGCSKETLDAIVTISPDRLVYVSCDPATLARDVRILTEKGYTVEKIQPVDMFPNTVHVETVVLLTRQNT
ncbi:MAG: 23S rRNA (uracil(1939)-C(5))-methyltransferase RlmD [Solobacterium sp.]|nr:23S rRNA (uracil(1939)-C(5))-methyltransferase RlmD [Solobacterium sp.]